MRGDSRKLNWRLKASQLLPYFVFLILRLKGWVLHPHLHVISYPIFLLIPLWIPILRPRKSPCKARWLGESNVRKCSWKSFPTYTQMLLQFLKYLVCVKHCAGLLRVFQLILTAIITTLFWQINRILKILFTEWAISESTHNHCAIFLCKYAMMWHKNDLVSLEGAELGG